MKKITPHLWFDKQAKEATEFYVSVFPNSKITQSQVIHDTPSGDCDILAFELCGQPFMAISAGPYFKLNPSISFQVRCKSKEEVDALWAKLSEGGMILMPLDKYPYSEHFGWVQDKYGVSWQLSYVGDNEFTQKIVPMIMYVGKACGKTEEAINLYTSVFAGRKETGESKVQMIQKYPAGSEPDKESTVQFAMFTLNGMEFAAMDSAHEHKFFFNEAVSFIIPCETQEEIDYFWEKLSAVPEAEQCGWIKDAYGVSWQITSTDMDEMMTKGTPEQLDRVTQCFLKMKKFDVAKLKEAFEG